METTAQRYDRLAGAFAAKIDAVPADQWDAQSPCEEWKAIDVVRHVTETPGMFFGFIGQEMGALPSVDDGPALAFAASRAKVQAALDDPEVANTTFEGMFGTQTFAEAIDRFICFDLLVHGWDLAHATGIDEAMDPADVERLDEASKQFGDKMRGPGSFG
ncbi:MAG: hypothetical protein JWO68_2040, partial [Actinomycetia bacterium]|nr:hypothetical protein [Actinomycetes bacterium]